MSSEKRILCITTKMCHGGVQIFLLNYARALKKYGIIFDLVVQTEDKQIFDDYFLELGSKFYRVPSSSISKYRYTKSIFNILKNHPEYRVIHTHLNYFNIYPLLAAFLLRVPHRISHSHSSYKASNCIVNVARVFLRFLINKMATDRVACSITAANWLYGNHEKVQIFHNAIDIDNYKYSSLIRADIRRKYSIPDDCFVWIHVGTFAPVKNHFFLLSLLKSVVSHKKSIKLVLCGDGGLKADICNYIKQNELTQNVLLLGSVNNVRDFLMAADLFLLPSLFEGLPLSAIEAQAAGLPCILSDVVSSEVVVADNVVRLPLCKEQWEEQCILMQNRNFKREDAYYQLKASNYDITSEVLRIVEFYNNM